jgi:histidinol-phosphate/aromatic aminotransferase/cobyric acid decarboxylase-like protein
MINNYSVRLATLSDKSQIYKIRHQIYAEELAQHQINNEKQLKDNLDEYNEYIVVRYRDCIVGFVSITPPNDIGYSIDKYISRSELPFEFHDRLFEIRLLTIIKEWRNSVVLQLLIYGVYLYLIKNNALEVVAIGRKEIMSLYLRIGFKTLGKQFFSGKVVYELMRIDENSFQEHSKKLLSRIAIGKYAGLFYDVIKIQHDTYHGGKFFEAIGEDFSTLEKVNDIINADVLDAWFNPAPEVIKQIKTYLSWEIRTSPPTHCAGVLDELERNRGLSAKHFVLGAGSSDLMFRAIPIWVKREHKVLILDPMYGEYAHLLENIVGCDTRRLYLDINDNYQVNLQNLYEELAQEYDWLFIVNPNSPTGQFTDTKGLSEVIRLVAPKTKVWIDETYIDYIDSSYSLERLACQLDNLVICKSLSKAYALSGLRSAYLCGNVSMISQIALFTPPWVLSLPAQIATVFALRNNEYYKIQWQKTNELRKLLAELLSRIDIEIISGAANFLLCRIADFRITAKELIERCQLKSLFLRDVSSMGTQFDPYIFRVSVKDAVTNNRIAEIIRQVLLDV